MTPLRCDCDEPDCPACREEERWAPHFARFGAVTQERAAKRLDEYVAHVRAYAGNAAVLHPDLRTVLIWALVALDRAAYERGAGEARSETEER